MASLEEVDCGVIVVAYNSASAIGPLLESLPSAADGLRLRTVVVDNGSMDGTVSVARSFPGVQCVETGSNLGYAGAINIGRQLARPCSAVAILNPDLRLHPGALATLCRAVSEPGVGVAFPQLLDGASRLYPSLRREPSLSRAVGDALFGRRFRSRPSWLGEIVWQPKEYIYRHPVDWATGAAVVVSGTCDAAIGDWDTGFFLYSEEVDFAARARDAGFGVEFVPEAAAHHEGGGSGSSDALVALMAVNRVRYYEKRHRRASASVFRALVVLHELVRINQPAHRRTVAIVLRRGRWAELPKGGASARPPVLIDGPAHLLSGPA